MSEKPAQYTENTISRNKDDVIAKNMHSGWVEDVEDVETSVADKQRRLKHSFTVQFTTDETSKAMFTMADNFSTSLYINL